MMAPFVRISIMPNEGHTKDVKDGVDSVNKAPNGDFVRHGYIQPIPPGLGPQRILRGRKPKVASFSASVAIVMRTRSHVGGQHLVCQFVLQGDDNPCLSQIHHQEVMARSSGRGDARPSDFNVRKAYVSAAGESLLNGVAEPRCRVCDVADEEFPSE